MVRERLLGVVIVISPSVCKIWVSVYIAARSAVDKGRLLPARFPEERKKTGVVPDWQRGSGRRYLP